MKFHELAAEIADEVDKSTYADGKLPTERQLM